MNKIIIILLTVILLLLVYLSFKSNDNSDYIEQLEQQNTLITEEIEGLKLEINIKLDSLKVIEKKETIIKNYYNEIFTQIDSITSFDLIYSMLRQKLDSLGSARLN
ncbi:MAG: hypothetical protein RBR74_06740 [Ignavibacteriaceae bacterium]|jgi:amino acid permease|nr:hypothetical protein [Ignavibacteriaceae bacterium]